METPLARRGSLGSMVKDCKRSYGITLMMTSAHVIEMSVTVTDYSPFQDYPHPDDHTTRSTVASWSRGGTPYNGLYGEAPPERGTFLRLQVYKRVGISQV